MSNSSEDIKIEMTTDGFTVDEKAVRKVVDQHELEQKVEAAYAAIDEIEADHIIVNFKHEPVVLECTRCNQTDPMRMNISLDYQVNLCRAFRLTHALCEEKV